MCSIGKANFLSFKNKNERTILQSLVKFEATASLQCSSRREQFLRTGQALWTKEEKKTEWEVENVIDIYDS